MIKYNHFNIDEKILSKIRKDIYHSSGPGFYVFKKHKLYHSEKLDFDYFKIKFDFAFAHSVLGHLSKGQVIKLFNNLKKNMKKNGYFYATINFGWWSQQNIGFLYEGITPMNHPVYKDINVYKKISKELNLTFEEVDFKHPSQKLVRFKF